MVATQIELLQELNLEYMKDPAFDHMKPADGTIRFVAGSGPINPKIMIVGEAPGELENARMIPFVGRAGANLMQILQKIGVHPADVYLTNAVKYRPVDQFGKNRTPTPEEMTASREYLFREITIVNPVVVGLAGKVPFRTVFPKDSSPREYNDFSRIHGTLLNEMYVPLYHPAVATYNPNRLPDLENGYRKLKRYSES